MRDDIKLFSRHTRTDLHNDGSVSIRCRKGLWAVSAPTLEQAIQEATRYFWQYYADREYDA